MGKICRSSRPLCEFRSPKCLARASCVPPAVAIDGDCSIVKAATPNASQTGSSSFANTPSASRSATASSALPSEVSPPKNLPNPPSSPFSSPSFMLSVLMNATTAWTPDLSASGSLLFADSAPSLAFSKITENCTTRSSSATLSSRFSVAAAARVKRSTAAGAAANAEARRELCTADLLDTTTAAAGVGVGVGGDTSEDGPPSPPACSISASAFSFAASAAFFSRAASPASRSAATASPALAFASAANAAARETLASGAVTARNRTASAALVCACAVSASRATSDASARNAPGGADAIALRNVLLASGRKPPNETSSRRVESPPPLPFSGTPPDRNPRRHGSRAVEIFWPFS
mmetsp:Transcript_1265/g.4186  ORF Transcript_1265/g.4186 Transcript_1265/m.4186 type:complete len:352 (-) Transcript_1265:3974-5029(-)